MKRTLPNAPHVEDEVPARKERAVLKDKSNIPRRRRACSEALKQPLVSPSLTTIKSPDSYDEEIFEYLCTREKKFVIDAKVLIKNNPRCQEYRSLFIDRLILIAHKFALSQEALYLAVSLIDRTLAMDGHFYSRIQLMGVTALFLVTKLDEQFPPSIDDLLKLSKNRFEKDDILDMEKELLRLHKFEISGVEPMTFINRLILVSEDLQGDEDFKEATIFLYDALLSSKFYSQFRCSLVSAGAIYGALFLKQREWTLDISVASSYKIAEVAPIAYKMLIKVYQMKTEEKPDPDQDGIRIKYMSKSQHRGIYRSAYFEETNLLQTISKVSKIMKTK